MVIDEILLNETSAQAKNSERLRMNYNIHSSLEDPVNRMLNALEPGTIVPIHRHMNPYKNESFVVLRGELDVLLYNDDRQIVEKITLNPLKGNYGIDIPGEIWHTLDVKDSGTIIYDVKAGPYSPIVPEDLLT